MQMRQGVKLKYMTRVSTVSDQIAHAVFTNHGQRFKNLIERKNTAYVNQFACDHTMCVPNKIIMEKGSRKED